MLSTLSFSEVGVYGVSLGSRIGNTEPKHLLKPQVYTAESQFCTDYAMEWNLIKDWNRIQSGAVMMACCM